MFENNKCNCGRPVRYTSVVDGEMVGSCNKYSICPTYDEIECQLKSLRRNYEELLKAALDISIYREGTKHYEDAKHVITKHIGR